MSKKPAYPDIASSLGSNWGAAAERKKELTALQQLLIVNSLQKDIAVESSSLRTLLDERQAPLHDVSVEDVNETAVELTHATSGHNPETNHQILRALVSIATESPNEALKTGTQLTNIVAQKGESELLKRLSTHWQDTAQGYTIQQKADIFPAIQRASTEAEYLPVRHSAQRVFVDLAPLARELGQLNPAIDQADVVPTLRAISCDETATISTCRRAIVAASVLGKIPSGPPVLSMA